MVAVKPGWRPTPLKHAGNPPPPRLPKVYSIMDIDVMLQTSHILSSTGVTPQLGGGVIQRLRSHCIMKTISYATHNNEGKVRTNIKCHDTARHGTACYDTATTNTVIHMSSLLFQHSQNSKKTPNQVESSRKSGGKYSIKPSRKSSRIPKSQITSSLIALDARRPLPPRLLATTALRPSRLPGTPPTRPNLIPRIAAAAEGAGFGGGGDVTV